MVVAIGISVFMIIFLPQASCECLWSFVFAVAVCFLLCLMHFYFYGFPSNALSRVLRFGWYVFPLFYLLYLRGADIVIITGDWILTSKHLHHHARRSFIVSLVTSAQLR